MTCSSKKYSCNPLALAILALCCSWAKAAEAQAVCALLDSTGTIVQGAVTCINPAQQPPPPNYAALPANDSRVAAFQGAQAGQAATAQLIAQGAQVQSAATPALNGTYAIDPAHQQQVTSVALYIAVNGKFPNGAATLPWPDIAGAPHVFPSATEFTAFATALANYVAAVQLGQSPSQPVAIP